MKRPRVRLPMVTMVTTEIHRVLLRVSRSPMSPGGGLRHLREVWVEMRRRAIQIKTEFKTIIVQYFATLFKETLSR